MYIVREVFVARPGMASKLARLMKDVSAKMAPGKVRVLTDWVAGFNTVVMETEAEDLATFEKRVREYLEKPEFRQQMAGYTELYTSGKREIWRVVD